MLLCSETILTLPLAMVTRALMLSREPIPVRTPGRRPVLAVYRTVLKRRKSPVASAAASAAGYFSIQIMLDSIWAYHVGMGVLPFLLATLLIFAIAVVTVGGRVYTIATSNPIHALRYE